LNTLRTILLGRIHDTPRSRGYQAGLDGDLDGVIQGWDLARGLIAASGAGPLPHECHGDFWSLPPEQQGQLCNEEHRRIYALNRGREGTAVLCQAAFCWHSPLSRHHRDDRLKRFFEAGLRFHLDSIRPDGLLGSYGYNGLHWAHGWDIEGLIYGLYFLGDELDADLRVYARQRLRLCAQRMLNFPRQLMVIGSIGNQRCVLALGLYLYGQWLEDPACIAASDHHWHDALPGVLDDSGQVIEQVGPCLHYSYTAFIYAWLNLVVRNDSSQNERVLRCLQWFRDRMTRSLYPFAGPTTRRYIETLGTQVQDLCPAIEQLAPLDPTLLRFMTRALWRARHLVGSIPADPCRDARTLHLSNAHGASTAMWSILMAQPETGATVAGDAGDAAAVSQLYESTHTAKRAPLRYLIVRRQYQTSFAFSDYMPFSGIQTWAWGDEPPVVHPTPLAPSTTQGDRLDTARQGTSHNWAGFGAGALGIDGYIHEIHEQGDDNAALLLVARYDWLFRVVVFTDCSTVMLELGHEGPRRTLWTLNRIDPAEPRIDPAERNIVRFGGRAATLHASTSQPPRVLTLADQHAWATDVRQLRYDVPDGPAAFGLSNGSLNFSGNTLDGSCFAFRDDSGSYNIHLHDGLLRQDNPGNLAIDTFQLAKGTFVRRREAL
jgi:hypothetical protein